MIMRSNKVILALCTSTLLLAASSAALASYSIHFDKVTVGPHVHLSVKNNVDIMTNSNVYGSVWTFENRELAAWPKIILNPSLKNLNTVKYPTVTVDFFIQNNAPGTLPASCKKTFRAVQGYHYRFRNVIVNNRGCIWDWE
jgi:hypothetical protein